MNGIGVINRVLYGFVEGKNLESSSITINYSPNSSPLIFSNTFQYIIDNAGLIQKVIVTPLNNNSTASIEVLTYY